MQYIYASMILHSAGTEITEDSVKKVLEAAGIEPDDTQLKMLVDSLDGLDIDEYIKLPDLPVTDPDPVDPTEEKSDEDDDDEEATGLTQLFPGMF